jgi:hypothetical protein
MYFVANTARSGKSPIDNLGGTAVGAHNIKHDGTCFLIRHDRDLPLVLEALILL